MIKPKKAVQIMSPYFPPTSSRLGKIRLDFNENTTGCSPKVVDALKRITAEEISAYPEYNETRELVANFNDIDSSKMLMTNAGDEGIMTVMNTFIGKGDKILLPVPTFAMFKFYGELNGADFVKVKYNMNLSFPTKKVIDSISEDIKMVVLVNPNNPTGTSIKKSDIVKILEKAKNSIVLLDEAYYDFTGNTCIDLIDKFPNLIVLRSFSKAFGLAGLRIGYLISNEDNIQNLQKVNSPYSICSLASRVIKSALEDRDYVKKYVKVILENKEYLYREFDRLGIKYYKGDANFFLADFGEGYRQVLEELKNSNILVRDRNSDVKNCLRITVGNKEQCEKLVNALERILIRQNKYDTLLFDMDGVMVDVSRSYRVAIKQTAEFFLKNEISFEDIQRYKERGGLNNDWDCTQAILKDNNVIVDRKKIIEKFDSIYLDCAIDNEKLIVDFYLLEKLSKKFNMAIITGRPKRDADYTIKKFGLDRYFKSFFTLDDFSNKADGIKECIKIFDSKDAIYIGDTVDDIASAKSVGIDAIGIVPPALSEKIKGILKKEGARIVLDSINEICEVIK